VAPTEQQLQLRRRVAVRAAEYWLADRGELSLTFSAVPGLCSCGAENPRGLWIHRRSEVTCPACVPAKRKCRRCERTLRMGRFRIYPIRKIIGSYCWSCERARLRDFYATSKAKVRVIPKRKRCSTCGRRKLARAFDRDNRYVDGLTGQCRDCRIG
jgi:hypothetical protein